MRTTKAATSRTTARFIDRQMPDKLWALILASSSTDSVESSNIAIYHKMLIASLQQMDTTKQYIIEKALHAYHHHIHEATVYRKLLKDLGWRGELAVDLDINQAIESYIVPVERRYDTLRDGVLDVINTAGRFVTVHQIERALRYNALHPDGDKRNRIRKVSQSLYAASKRGDIASISWTDDLGSVHVWGKPGWITDAGTVHPAHIPDLAKPGDDGLGGDSINPDFG